MALIYDGILRRKVLPLYCFLPIPFSDIDALTVFEFAQELEVETSVTFDVYDIYGHVMNTMPSANELVNVNSFILIGDIHSDICTTIERVWNDNEYSTENWRYCSLNSNKNYYYFCLDLIV